MASLLTLFTATDGKFWQGCLGKLSSFYHRCVVSSTILCHGPWSGIKCRMCVNVRAGADEASLAAQLSS